MSKKPTKRDMAGDLVGAFGRFLADSPNSGYSVRLNGKFFTSFDTAYLADKVALWFNKAELTALMLTIPEPPPYEDDEGYADEESHEHFERYIAGDRR